MGDTPELAEGPRDFRDWTHKSMIGYSSTISCYHSSQFLRSSFIFLSKLSRRFYDKMVNWWCFVKSMRWSEGKRVTVWWRPMDRSQMSVEQINKRSRDAQKSQRCFPRHSLCSTAKPFWHAETQNSEVALNILRTYSEYSRISTTLHGELN